MQLTIGKKEYELHFGIDFIRELDKRYNVTANSMTFGTGLQSATVYLLDENPVVLMDIVQCATHTLKSQPSVDEIEAWLEGQADNLDVLFTDFLTQLKTAPMTRKKVGAVLEATGM